MDVARNLYPAFQHGRASPEGAFVLSLVAKTPCSSCKEPATFRAVARRRKKERSPCLEEGIEGEHRDYIRQIWEGTEAGQGSALDHANHRRRVVVYESAVLRVRDYLLMDSFRMAVRHALDIDGLCPEI